MKKSEILSLSLVGIMLTLESVPLLSTPELPETVFFYIDQSVFLNEIKIDLDN